MADLGKCSLDSRFRSDGYDVGFSADKVAGQTVMHLLVHVIPRYGGDVDHPRGGMRGAIPARRILYTNRCAEPVGLRAPSGRPSESPGGRVDRTAHAAGSST